MGGAGIRGNRKKDADSGKNLAGAVYGIYSDEACTNLIVEMPATDKNGASKVTFLKTQNKVYLKRNHSTYRV